MSEFQHNTFTGADGLLRTKLRPPRLHPALVLREPLFARLDAGLDRQLTLLSAPPGFGKTTLVSQWLAHLGFSADPSGAFGSEARLEDETSRAANAAWVSLDAGDNDPVRFWRYVLTACQAFRPGLGSAALEMLHSARQPPFEGLLTHFINELTQLPGRYILVLEDYHAITSSQIHQAVTFLLDHLPGTLHLVLLTRNDPPLPLARLRARGVLNELRAADLRFSPAETEAFVQQALPSRLSHQVAARLEARVEGWAAGLHLAVLALQGRRETEIEQFLVTFAGSYRHILDYLAEEVLDAQPESIQAFLLQTTLLNRLTASLCDAVAGRSDSQVVLEQLERANLFLAPLDAARQWYRYHPLFAEAMQHEARHRLGEAELVRLHEKASAWYEQHDFPDEAVEAALSSRAFDRAAGLIDRLVGPHKFYGEVHTLRRWLEQLPEHVLSKHPSLCLAYAMAILFTEDRRASSTAALLETPLQLAEQGWQAEGNQAKLGEALTFRAMVAWWQEDLPRAFELARQALELLPEDEEFWRGIALLHLGVEERLAGRLNPARQLLLTARSLCKTAGNIHAAMAATSILGEVLAQQGELQQAAQFQRQVQAEADRVEVGEPLEDQAQASINLAALAYEWNDLETAEADASRALDIGRQLGIEHFLVHSSLTLARIRCAREEMNQAQELLQTLAAQVKHPLLNREVQAGLARLALAAGDTQAARRWSVTRAEPAVEVPFVQQEQEALILARLLIAQEEAAEALSLLEGWQAGAHAQGRIRSELEMLILQALAHFSAANLPQARQMLLQALALAQPEGYRRLFLDEGEPLAALLRAVLPEFKDESLASYGRALQLAFTEIRPGAAHTPGAADLVEPLSSQEQRVLRLLAAGLSNPEIAEELVVSINTVKSHVKSIFRKLDIHNREEAGEAARQFNLL